ncbi:TetR/AcrR family transcriptional regulator [Tropicibacter sp. R16_0]|uniref:TetR/AcrR family transcriptional regulator n=1 Tax=Tropicibacter sp. R16_0 TaxID=2821102 RepID=UPI001AD95EC9|nr:TetR/AcrR family transcriptional regulator [Tropicibacter sp. R16_0]MBO9450304.1 TetR/AcrR family transcriptional regulator [Tropicibacter sp. R16_0]
MPKIVDHQAHSKDLAQRAAIYFSDHGYAGTSMRKVAEFLGLSKSALYHYFPTKEDLFLACTKEVMAAFDADIVDPELSEEENLHRLKEALHKDFATEMALIFDYLRGKDRTEIAGDEAMQIAVQAYRTVATRIVGKERAEDTLARLFGELMLDYMSGR